LLAVTGVPRSALAQAQQAQQPRAGGTLVIGITGDPTILNPAATTNIPATQVSGSIYGTLLRMDNDHKVQPGLAERWEVGADGKSYTLYLRKNVKWHDGKPFTAHDAKFSLLEVNRKFNGQGTTAYAQVETIDAPDDHTLVIRLKGPSAAFFPWSLTEMTFAQIVPKHIYEGSDPTKNDANFNPIGTGPYKFKEWVKGDHITLERNPDYWDAGRPYLERIVFKIIPDNAARVIALEKGEIDFIPYYALPASAVRQLEKLPGLKVFNTSRPAAGEIIMFYNLRHERLKVKEVRQALAHAIDRQALIDKALEGMGNYPKSLIPTSQPEFHTDKGRQYEYSPEKANALLDQVGFRRGADGNRFGLRLSYDRAAEAGALSASAQIIREQLAAVGIGLEIVPLDATAWGDASFIKWDFDLTMGSFATGPDPSVGTARLYISSNIKPLFAHNLMGYSNPQADELFARGDVELDPAKRVGIYHQIQEILNEDVPALPLWEKWYPIAHKAEFVGLPPGPLHSEPMDLVWWSQAQGGTAQSGGSTGGGTNLVIGLGVLVALGVVGFVVWRRRAAAKA
jgi:peptide/nickel transport system substrate-binding protein